MPKKLDNFIRNHPVWFLFVSIFLLMFLICLPDIIMAKGYFYFYGDYNLVEMPFYIDAHRAIRSGQTAWDFTNGLGSDFIGMYSYYCITSPFFWLTIPFPTSFVPFLFPYLMCFKIALSGVFAYLYIKRFVKSQNACLIGSFLYAFSGFQANNLFYPDFAEVFTFFPLLLIALEELIQNNKKGWFALTVMLSAVLNYYFFSAEIVFCIIYFCVRCNIFVLIRNLAAKLSKIGKTSFIKIELEPVEADNKDFPVTWKKFFSIVIEGLAGVLMAGFVLMPTLIHLSSNNRLSERLYGNDWLFFTQANVFTEIIRTMFMMPDMPAYPLLFDGDQKWSSTAIFLPLFGMIGVIAFIKNHKKHWLTKISTVCLIFALIPILNSSFNLFMGHVHYARWFYMPILLLCVMTAYAVQELREEYYSLGVTDSKQNEDSIMVGVFPEPVKDSYKSAFKITAFVLLIFSLIAYIPVQFQEAIKSKDEKELLSDIAEGSTSTIVKSVWGEFAPDLTAYMLCLLFVVVTYILLYNCVIKKKRTGRALLYLTALCCAVTMGINFYRVYSFPKDTYILSSIKGEISLPDEGYYRTNTNDDFKNFHLFWENSGINIFHNTANSSLYDFYYDFDLAQSTQHLSPNTDFYAVNGLLSVKYYLENKDAKLSLADFSQLERKLPGFEKTGTQAEYDVYENKNYVPIGFAYDYYITEETIDDYKEEHEKDEFDEDRYEDNEEQMSVATVNALMNSMLLSEEQIEKYSDIIKPMPENLYADDRDLYVKACEERRSMSCYSFEYDTKGFEAKINLDKSRLVFFSIPYSEGWNATVNGKPAEIEIVDSGLMAVKVPQGETVIRFRYSTPGLEDGILMSFGGLILFIIIMFPSLKKKLSALRKISDI
ncbi:MAG: YfhO family protein [Oscillospiraceae bacterium]|jgi:hypothetical protein|nr:YfhO family protein [Oscillospiraceae bacterium]